MRTFCPWDTGGRVANRIIDKSFQNWCWLSNITKGQHPDNWICPSIAISYYQFLCLHKSCKRLFYNVIATSIPVPFTRKSVRESAIFAALLKLKLPALIFQNSKFFSLTKALIALPFFIPPVKHLALMRFLLFKIDAMSSTSNNFI